MSAARFEDLLRGVLDGESQDLAAMDSSLQNDPVALAEYLDQIELDALLEWELGGGEATPVLEAPEVPRTRTTWLSAAAKPLAAVAAVAVLLCVGYYLGQRKPTGLQQGQPPAVAVLIDSEDCVWESGRDQTYSFGSSFSAGESLRIASGVARLAMQSKAGVAVLGPAEIELVSSEEVKVVRGNVSAFAPEEAIGFKLTTPDVEIVDLGTRFAASVAPDGTTDVHVFEGEISVQRRSSGESAAAGELVTTGQARRYSSGGTQRTEIEIAPEHFAEPPALEQLLAIEAGGTPTHTSERTDRMFSKPGLIVAQQFAEGEGELDGQFGGTGFANAPWLARSPFTRFIPRVQSHSGEASAGGYLLVRGRDKAEAFVANRMRRPLAEPLPQTFFFAVRASFHGLDEDDFFSLWIDTNGREDASHADVPTLGIREGRYFARVDVDHAAVAGEAVEGGDFVIAGRYEWRPGQNRAEIALWVNPPDSDAPADAVCEGPVKKRAPGEFRFLGLRVGQYTEVSDRLLIHGLAVGTTLQSAMEAVAP